MSLEHLALEIADTSEQQAYAEGCRKLWHEVMKRAALDIVWLRKPGYRDSQTERDIVSNSPTAFVDGPWFDVVCGYLETDAEVLRQRFNELIERVA